MGVDSAEPDWSRLSAFIAGALGLHFPRERWSDLQRGMAAATDEFGFNDAAACAEWLLSAPPTKAQLQILASHLTIGETYFFREKKTFETLADSILPKLIHSRRSCEKRLRIWSAGCCSGEEAYSLAILLRQVLPDLADWRVTILATDINPRFLRKAVAGSYGEWSFRDAPAGFKERYFNRGNDGRYVVVPEIKRMVTFAHLNLAEDSYPSLATDTNAMDLIFCRNVLMYFTPAQTGKVVANLHRALLDGGWLAVSPSEVSQALFSGFATRNFPGVVLYEKSAVKADGYRMSLPALSDEVTAGVAPLHKQPVATAPLTPPLPSPQPTKRTQEDARSTPYVAAAALYEQGRYTDVVNTLLASVAQHPRDPRQFSLLARALANQGKLADALAWCDRWIAADKLDPAGHYLRAIVLLERGNSGEARSSLQRTIYLNPAFVLAHFTLGNLARAVGKSDEADKHFSNTRQLLARYQANDLLPESDGLTAGRLTETIAALIPVEAIR
jgi:chemotaxis protein methyltransferase CheR